MTSSAGLLSVAKGWVTIHGHHVLIDDSKNAGTAAAWAWGDQETRYDSSVPAPAIKDWESGLTEDQKVAVKQYTTGGYRELNAALREGSPLSADQQQLATHLDAVIAAAGTYDKPVTVWRGIDTGSEGMPSGYDLAMTDDREALVRSSVAKYAQEGFTPGSVVELGGYQSTSFSAMPALSASVSAKSPGQIFEIRTSHGAYISPALSTYDDESELLLGRGQRYRVVGVLPDVQFEASDGSIARRTVIKVEAL
ncbi:MAG: hypothetical protein NVS2B7_29040 [Herpetosiphon sp.]